MTNHDSSQAGKPVSFFAPETKRAKTRIEVNCCAARTQREPETNLGAGYPNHPAQSATVPTAQPHAVHPTRLRLTKIERRRLIAAARLKAYGTPRNIAVLLGVSESSVRREMTRQDRLMSEHEEQVEKLRRRIQIELGEVIRHAR